MTQQIGVPPPENNLNKLPRVSPPPPNTKCDCAIRFARIRITDNRGEFRGLSEPVEVVFIRGRWYVIDQIVGIPGFVELQLEFEK